MLETMRGLSLEEMVRVKPEEARGPMIYIEALDWKLPGIVAGKLVVIGGYVGSYKTLMGINIMYNNVVNLHYNACFISLEMYARDIYRRLAVRHANSPVFEKYNQVITMKKLINGEFTKDEEDLFYGKVVPDLNSNPKYGNIIVVDSLEKGVQNIDQVAEYVDEKMTRADKKQNGLHLLIIDYIQLLSQWWGDTLQVDRITATGKMARWLKELAMSFKGKGLTVFALSQLSRAAFMSAKESIKNSHENDPYQYIYNVTSFAESSEIERASDACITIYSDDKLKEQGQALVQLIKNRDGETIDMGIRVRALPNFGYIGDMKMDQDAKARDEAVGKLLPDVLTW